MVDMKKLDANFEEAARMVVSTGRASTSYLQTTMGMWFARSARVMAQLEAAGIVGPQDPKSKNREVLVKTYDELDTIIKRFKGEWENSSLFLSYKRNTAGTIPAVFLL